MKKLIPLLLLFAPFFASGQINMEVYGTVGKTYFTNDLIPEDDRIAFGGGFAFSGRLKSEKMHWVAGFQLSTIREKRETELRWGSQHDGNGGFDPAILDPVIPNALDFRETMYFVEVPVGIRYFLLDKKWSLFLQPTLGPSFYVTTHKKQTLFYPSGNKEKTINNGREEFIRRVNLIGNFSVGVEMPISPKMKLLVMPQAGVSFFEMREDFSFGQPSDSNPLQYYFGLRAGLQFTI